MALIRRRRWYRQGFYSAAPLGPPRLLFGGAAGTANFWRLGELHLLEDLVGVSPEVQVLLEEVPAPVGEHLLGPLLHLLLHQQRDVKYR